MKFDLFDAMRILKYRLGEDARLEIYHVEHAIMVRISVYHDDGDIAHYQYAVHDDEMNDSYVDVMNIKFKDAVTFLVRG